MSQFYAKPIVSGIGYVLSVVPVFPTSYEIWGILGIPGRMVETKGFVTVKSVSSYF